MTDAMTDTVTYARIALLLLFCCPGASPATASSPSEGAITADVSEGGPLVLGQGEQRLLKIEGLLRFSIGGTAARAFPLPSSLGNQEDSLLLKGTAPGVGDLWIWRKDGQTEHRLVRVEKTTPADIKPGLERALGRLQETEVVLSGGGAVLRGQVRSLGESARIAALVDSYPNEIQDQTQTSDELLDLGQSRLSAWLSRSPYAYRLRIERAAGTLFVRGSITRADEAQAIRKQLKSIFPRVALDLQALPDDAMTVHFKVYLIELKKNRFRNLGLTWPASQPGAFRVTTSGIQDMLALDLTLESLEAEGSAKVLSKPELVVRAPGEAELFSGGELPITNRGYKEANTTWKPFGLALRLKVSHSTGDRVRLDILTEVSSLDPTIENEAHIPGLQTNRMKTQVDARYGAPLLLSGLLQEQMRQRARGIPLLRQIPVLGLLFGSEDWLSERSELVAILLPSAAPPAAPMEKTEIFSKAASSPRGLVPPPRNWISPSEMRTLKESRDYPWNSFARK